MSGLSSSGTMMYWSLQINCDAPRGGARQRGGPNVENQNKSSQNPPELSQNIPQILAKSHSDPPPNLPKIKSEAPMKPQRHPRSAPERPRNAKKAPKSAQTATKGLPKLFKMEPWRVPDPIFTRFFRCFILTRNLNEFSWFFHLFFIVQNP